MTEQFTFSAAVTVEDTRVFSGVAVPYEQVTRDGRNIRFAKGSFGDLESQALTALMIQHPMNNGEKAVRVGRVTDWTDSDEALTFTARLNDSPEADTIYEALKSGDVTEVSVGVYVDEFSEDEDGVVTYSSASLLELSLITEGLSAFENSKISSVFMTQDDEGPTSQPTTIKESNMENITEKVESLEDSVDDLSRSFAEFVDSNKPVQTAPAAGSNIQSFGEYVKAIAKGDEAANEIYLAYTGGTSADNSLKNAWVEDAIVRVNKPRKLMNAFSSARLPEQGMVLEYAKWDANTLAADIQAAEGDDLQWGTFSFTSATAPVKTVGGGTSLSRAEIERGDINVVGEAFEGLSSAYGARTEAYFRTQYLSATSTSVTGVDLSDPDDLTGFVVDAAGVLEDGGLNADFVVVSRDVFKTLSTVRVGSEGEFFLSRANGAINLKGISGDLAGIPFVVISGTTGHFSVCSKDAMRSYESGGAPFRLQDENIVNLTKDFSVYGYLAVANRIENAIVSAS